MYMSKKVFAAVEDQVLQLVEKGGLMPWQKPWKSDGSMESMLPVNGCTGKIYTGTNTFLLNFVGMARGFASNQWAGFGQWKKKGYSVRKGERSTAILAPIFRKVIDPDTKKEEEKLVAFRYVRVFNICQTTAQIEPEEESEGEFDPIAEAEAIVDGYKGPSITHAGNSAVYSPTRDAVTVPKKDSFKSPQSYYCTLFHELGHSTGHKSRLNRPGIMKGFLTDAHEYSYEELVAEFTSCFLGSLCGVFEETKKNSAAYIKTWLSRLRSEPGWLCKAANDAYKASNFILSK